MYVEHGGFSLIATDFASGTSVDWVHYSTSADYVYTIELRPDDGESRGVLPDFCLPADEIEPTFKELLAGLAVLHEQMVVSDFEIPEDSAEQAAVGGRMKVPGPAIAGAVPITTSMENQIEVIKYALLVIIVLMVLSPVIFCLLVKFCHVA